MTQVHFPSISIEEWQLSKQLSGRKTHYSWQNIHAYLAPDRPPDSVDLQLLIHWHGHALTLLCHQSALAQWLAPQLQEAELTVLPEPLLLALLERESAALPMLIWDSVTLQPVTSVQHTLSVRLTKGTNTLVLWLAKVPTVLLTQLSERPLAERLPVPLILSLQLDTLTLPVSELRDLEQGDILLLNYRLTAETPLLGVVQGYPWCLFHLNESTLEVIAMHQAPSTEQEQHLKNLDELSVNVSFEIGRKSLDLQSLSNLQPGSSLSLDCPLDGEVRILVNHQCLGVGRLVNIQDRLGIQVISLCQGTHL